jgi:hypothetical protein
MKSFLVAIVAIFLVQLAVALPKNIHKKIDNMDTDTLNYQPDNYKPKVDIALFFPYVPQDLDLPIEQDLHENADGLLLFRNPRSISPSSGELPPDADF